MILNRLKGWVRGLTRPRGTPPTAVRLSDDLLKRFHVTRDEFQRIVDILGRPPNDVELNIFSVMWSEHCSYKSSKIHLKKFSSTGDRVLQGPGENAGVIDLGNGWGVAVKIESHNHPSYIEPYQGAATGVGGILRDIFTMGARPVVLLNSLRVGSLDDPSNRHLLDGIVRGVAGYGNCVGIPTAGGELVIQELYTRNPLVNVLCAGVLRTDRLVHATAHGPGNKVIYIGSKTGRDGIHGATMASAQFEAGDEDKRPAVQVGDPFIEKKLLEACLEMAECQLLVGLQDLGAAGLTSASLEMANRAGTGLRLDLDRVPLREAGMQPHEICLSESQERMLAVVTPANLEAVQAICQKWELESAEIGEVTSSGQLDLSSGGRSVASVPIGPLTDGAPRYERPMKSPRYLQALQSLPLEFLPTPGDLTKVLLTLIGSPSLSSRRWIYEQYDHMVGTNTILLPGADAAVVRLKQTEKAIAVSVDGNPGYCLLNPYVGGAMAVMEGARNVTCVGAKPLAVTDCLNFGSPEDPETLWQFAACVDGIADACRFLGLPVVSGNVSFYNETNGQPIYPSPVIGTIGLIEPIERLVAPWFQSSGDIVLLLGQLKDDLGMSEYLRIIHHQERGLLPELVFEEERAVQQTCQALIDAGMVRSAHDCAEGGLAVALAEASIGRPANEARERRGATISITPPPDTRLDGLLFGEGQSRIILTIQEDKFDQVKSILKNYSTAWSVIGHVGGDRLTVTVTTQATPEQATRSVHTVIDIDLTSLHNAWYSGLSSLMGNEVRKRVDQCH